jgi:hypothetical protein
VVELLNLLAEPAQAECLVLMLAALLAGSDDDAGGQVLEPNGALRLVNVLTSGAARTKGVNFTFSQQVCVGFRQYNHGFNNSLKASAAVNIFFRKATAPVFSMLRKGFDRWQASQFPVYFYIILQPHRNIVAII